MFLQLGTMSKALVLIAPGFEEIEFTVPVDILRRGGVDVTIASILGQFILFFIPCLSFQIFVHWIYFNS